MTSPDDNNLEPDPVDEAVRRRLAQLGSMPVDLSRLSRAINAAVPKPEPRRRQIISAWLRPSRVAAASVLICGIILALVISTATGPALASADRLAAIHIDSLSGAHSNMPVDNVIAASEKLKEKWPTAPSLPSVDGTDIKSCCLHHLDGKKVACVTLNIDAVPVSLVVAHATEVTCPHANMVTKNGIDYCVMNSGDVNVLMWNQGTCWMSLVGRVPNEKLLEVAQSIKF